MKNIVAIYARLSREDEGKIDGSKESRSIENQITTLSDYARNHNFDIYKIYFDDGYSGGNTNRPAFNQMIDDMKKKKFNIILIKDLSRLGRNLHQVGELIEEIFPKNNIRCISVTDNYDSLTYNGDESIVLRNFLNAYYLKDFKKKVNKSIEHRSKTKHMTTSAKYGYFVKKCGVVELDPYASGIVKMIFELACEGMKMPEIANQLNEMGILPRSKYQIEVLKVPSNHKWRMGEKWNSPMVGSILNDIEYCGHSVNLQYSKRSEPVIIKNTHVAIVTDDQYELAQKVARKNFPHIHKKPDNIASLMRLEHNNDYIKCNYQDRPKPKYSATRFKFNLDLDIVHNIIYEDVVTFIKDALEHKEVVLETIKKRYFINESVDTTKMKEELLSLNNKYAKLFEDNLLGKLSQAKFKKESESLKLTIKQLEENINNASLLESKIDLLERRFYSFLDSIDLTKSKLELIRMAVKRIWVSRDEEDSLVFKIVYKFE